MALLSNHSEAYLSLEDEKIGATATHMQCWFWGLDVKHPEGNILIKRGFRRYRAPKGKDASSCYELHIPDRKRLLLWGFGLALVEDNNCGIYLNRYKFRPVQIVLQKPRTPIFHPEELQLTDCKGTLEWKRCLELLSNAVSWIVAYEKWIEEEMSARYRQRCQELFDSDDEIWKTSPISTWSKVERAVAEALSSIISKTECVDQRSES
jgi:hypothetical protein